MKKEKLIDSFGKPVETFLVWGMKCTINKTFDGKFVIFVGGGGITSPLDTLMAARQYLWAYLMSRLTGERERAQLKVKSLSDELNMLGEDFFSLGRFKQTI